MCMYVCVYTLKIIWVEEQMRISNKIKMNNEDGLAMPSIKTTCSHNEETSLEI